MLVPIKVDYSLAEFNWDIYWVSLDFDGNIWINDRKPNHYDEGVGWDLFDPEAEAESYCLDLRGMTIPSSVMKNSLRKLYAREDR